VRFSKEALVDIKVAETLWASSMLPQGVVERWRVGEGAMVAVGDVLVEVRIEDAMHEIVAPTAGRLAIGAAVNSIVEPGSVLGQLEL
jgi:pyruvate/2-oxoglutarate dehydrogenase complex dihydrolipoamide acyltransferase (E2) component